MSEKRRVLLLAAGGSHALHEGVMAYAHEANWILDSRMTFTGQVPDGAVVDGVLCRRIDRLDVTGVVRGLNVPVVGMEGCGQEAGACVSCRDDLVGRKAAQHLVQRGYQTLAFCDMHNPSQRTLRMQGFQAAAEAAGKRFVHLGPPEGLSGTERPDVIREWLPPLLSTLRLPLAIMAEDDLYALPLIDALVACGYGVPERVAVISAGNDPMLCELAPVAVSSVDTRPYEVGYRAAQLLDRRMQGEPVPDEPVWIEPGPVETRASSDMMALPNLHAARALRFIWTRYRDPINVDSVAAHVPVTRRRLQTLFHEQLGRTMQEEIARVRIADACLMLKQTRMRIREIASHTGFKSSLHFHRTAQTVLELGPKAFRETGLIPDFGVLPAQVGDRVPSD